jgi:AcrR family transcriptional regulator
MPEGEGGPARLTRKIPKFRRIGSEERRAALIAATLRCLRKHGHEGASVRRISAEAGVSMGLINHHFDGSAGLVAAAYESLANAFVDASERRCADAGEDPREQLRAFCGAYLAPDVPDPGLFGIWLIFWSLMATSPEVRAVHAVTAQRSRQLLEKQLRRLRKAPGVPSFHVGKAAVALTAWMDGMWVTMSLDPASLTAKDALASCEDWIQALARGELASLRR